MLSQAFGNDWRQGLFMLGSRSELASLSSTARYWGEIAAHYLTGLCHIPPTESRVEVEHPVSDRIDAWVEAAPPMPGGEYLGRDTLISVWRSLNAWVAQTVQSEGGLDEFLGKYAPSWKKVGRVTFHLAENKNDSSRPFAFMASFTTGMGSSGQVKHLPLGKALEIYAGAKNKLALIRLLGPVDEAGRRCDWVRKMVDSGDIYRPMAWSANQAYQMLSSAEQLEESGLMVRLPDWWKKRPRPRVSAVIGESRGEGFGVDTMLDFRVDVALGDENLSSHEVQSLLQEESGLVLFKGQWVEVDKERLQQALEQWKEVQKTSRDGQVTFIEGMRLLAGTSRQLEPDDMDQEHDWSMVRAGRDMHEMLHRLRSPDSINFEVQTADILATLRSYQLEGAAWMHFVTGLGLGACLADDMGLGKTLQVLTLLSHQSALGEKDPSLLIVPASLLGNWRNEAARFAPKLRLMFYHTSEMSRKDMQSVEKDPGQGLEGYDLVVTTYAMVSKSPWLINQKWRLVILDEAQAVKNHSTRQTRAVKKLPARGRIALTGTPIENRLGDLWSLFDFLNPGLLGNVKEFQRFINNVESSSQRSFRPLRRLVSPYILRRLKTDKSIISDLPEKTETVRFCHLTREQVKYYSQSVRNMEKALADRKQSDEMARRGVVLQTIMRLKQICNHPGQFLGDGDYAPNKSGKFDRISEICTELAQRQEKVLVFTQFREIIPALEEHLAKVFGKPGLQLHGGVNVRKRKAIVANFQKDDGPPFLILSLKAGGTGLNLTAASHVIHFDRWWNPAVENQATDRSFRIGQKKNVLVHKFVVSGTIEEKIDRLINEKKELAREMLSEAGEIRVTEMADDELLELVRLDLSRAVG